MVTTDMPEYFTRLCTIEWSDYGDTLGFTPFFDNEYNCYVIELKYDGDKGQSNAEDAGVKKGDVLIEIDAQNIEQWSEQQVDDFLYNADPGVPVELKVVDPDDYQSYLDSFEPTISETGSKPSPPTPTTKWPPVSSSNPPGDVFVSGRTGGSGASGVIGQPSKTKVNKNVQSFGNLTRTAVTVTFNKSIIRVHRLEASPDGKFGFKVTPESEQNNEFLVGAVTPDSEAALQGLQADDRILEIDSEPTFDMPYRMMQRLLKTAANVGHVCIRVHPTHNRSILVVDHADDEHDTIDSEMALFTRPSESGDPKPHDCLLIQEAKSSALGFDMIRKENNDTPVVVSVQPNGPAYRSGLRNGDRIIYIDNKNIQQMKSFEIRKQSIQSAFEANGRVNLLVFSEREFELLKSKGGFVEFHPAPAESTNSNRVQIKRHELKRLEHERDFGFDLKQDHMTFIHSVQPTSTADKSGIRRDDKVVSLNGKDVTYLSDQRIKHIMNDCTEQREMQIVVARLSGNERSTPYPGLHVTKKQPGQGGQTVAMYTRAK